MVKINKKSVLPKTSEVVIGTGNMRGLVSIKHSKHGKWEHYTTPEAKKLGFVKSTPKPRRRSAFGFNTNFRF